MRGWPRCEPTTRSSRSKDSVREPLHGTVIHLREVAICPKGSKLFEEFFAKSTVRGFRWYMPASGHLRTSAPGAMTAASDVKAVVIGPKADIPLPRRPPLFTVASTKIARWPMVATKLRLRLLPRDEKFCVGCQCRQIGSEWKSIRRTTQVEAFLLRFRRLWPNRKIAFRMLNRQSAQKGSNHVITGGISRGADRAGNCCGRLRTTFCRYRRRRICHRRGNVDTL